MVLFKNLFADSAAEKKYVPKDIRDAYASVLYCCANADKNISDEELISLDNSFINLPVFEGYDEGEYLMLAENNTANFTALEIFKGSFSFIKEKSRAKLFCYCCDIFLADEAMSEEEQMTLDKIAEISGIDKETINKIVAVALIRNIKDE